MKLKDKVAIITGGARGIGKCFALRFVREGAHVVIADIGDPSGVLKGIAEEGGKGFAARVDVSNEEGVFDIARQVVNQFGKIDILINNAALVGDHMRKPFDEITGEEWDRVMAVNVKGMFFCAKAVYPQMKQQGKGKIINLCSSTVFKGVPNFLHYVTSKGAIAALTRCLAKELGSHGINVNGIAPGYTVSDIFVNSPEEYKVLKARERALPRTELPRDLEGTAVFLASDDSDFITGQIIVVDGGNVMR